MKRCYGCIFHATFLFIRNNYMFFKNIKYRNIPSGLTQPLSRARYSDNMTVMCVPCTPRDISNGTQYTAFTQVGIEPTFPFMWCIACSTTLLGVLTSWPPGYSQYIALVEATGLEPPASWTQTKHSTKLSYASKNSDNIMSITHTEWWVLSVTNNIMLTRINTWCSNTSLLPRSNWRDAGFGNHPLFPPTV